MAHERQVVAEELTVEGFSPYGQAILAPTTPAPKTGVDWDCWFGMGRFGVCDPVVGMVLTRPTDGRVCAMEREDKVECLIPISGAVIQTVAVPGDLQDHTQQPDARTVRAFIVRPGQCIIMSPGTWHWASLPLEQSQVLYYFVTTPHPPEPGREASPWVPFIGDETVRVVKPD